MEAWEPGREIVRVYDSRGGPLDFNPTDSPGRFRPIYVAGRVVPTLYGAADAETALAEGLLRGVSALRSGRRRRLYRAQVEGHRIVTLRCEDELRLARLHGAGLQRLGLTRQNVIDTEESEFPYTATWARALWGSKPRPHGIVWTSRQNDSARAMILWENRVRAASLAVLDHPVALDVDPGLDLVRQACLDADVDLEI